MNGSSKPDTSNSCNSIASLSDFFTLWLDKLESFYEERDRRYEDRFKAQEMATSAAISASEKLTASAFAASKEAISKAETAQNTYNHSHNDLTRKMDSQYKEMLPRPESDIKFKAQEDKLEELKKEIAGLREYRSSTGGRSNAIRDSLGFIVGAFGIGASLALIVFYLLSSLKLVGH